MINLRKLSIMLLGVALIGLNSCSEDDQSDEDLIIASRTVEGVVVLTGTLSSLETALSVASEDLKPALANDEKFTLFAPENSAFENLAEDLGYEDAAALLADIDADLLTEILSYHVVAGSNPIETLTDGSTFQTNTEDELLIAITSDEEVQVLDATKISLNNSAATIVGGYPEISNGVVHYIDKVLLPPSAVEALNIDTRPSILDLSQNSEDLSLLLGIIEKSGLESTVADLNSVTLLAPSNRAVEALLDAMGEDYNSLEDFDNQAEIELLGNIIKYHVLTGSADLMAGEAETALEDSSVEVIAANGGFEFADATATNANVISADIDAKNGTVQIIDRVLLPQGAINFLASLNSADMTSVVIDEPQLSLLEQALVATELTETFMDTTNESFVQGEDEEDEDFEARRTPDNFTYFKPATVLAPSNRAFQSFLDLLGDGYTGIESFDTPEELELLKNVLLYHVVSGKLTSEDLNAGSVTTLAGTDIKIISSVGSNSFVIGDASDDVNAKIDTADVLARNGVAHVIDKVLLSKEVLDFISSLEEEDND